ncbi:MAG: DUF881 domain-containing protein [Arachnia sp.]
MRETARRAVEEAEEGAEQSRSAVMGWILPSRAQGVVGVVLFLTAILVVVTLRSQAEEADYSSLRRSELIQLLDNLSAETRRLEAEIRDLQTTRDELAGGAVGAEEVQAAAGRRLNELEIIGGTVPVKGAGIRITIADPKRGVSAELLLDAVEELRDAGAEVIEFNDGVRLVAYSWIAADDQGTIMVDSVPLQAPFVIEAIGNPATLEAGARFRGGLVTNVEDPRIGGTVTIEQSDEITIDTVVEPRDLEFAESR